MLIKNPSQNYQNSRLSTRKLKKTTKLCPFRPIFRISLRTNENLYPYFLNTNTELRLPHFSAFSKGKGFLISKDKFVKTIDRFRALECQYNIQNSKILA
jgi:hypothetical protein